MKKGQVYFIAALIAVILLAGAFSGGFLVERHHEIFVISEPVETQQETSRRLPGLYSIALIMQTVQKNQSMQ